MANFRLLPSGNWNAQVRIKGKPPQSKTFSTKAETESWANQIEAVTMGRKYHTIYTLGMTYCETMLKGKGSYDHAMKIVDHLERHFTRPIHEITAQMINDYKIMRLKKVKPSMCRTQLAYMSRFYRFAKRGLLIDIHNPVSDIALPKPDQSSDKVIRASELERLLAKLSPTVKLIVELAYETAMRLSEILKLTIDCLHLKESRADAGDIQPVEKISRRSEALDKGRTEANRAKATEAVQQRVNTWQESARDPINLCIRKGGRQ